MGVLDLRGVPARRAVPAAVGFVLAVTAVAAAGSLSAGSAAQSYATLVQPAWAPPSWLFGPVWSLLYALIAFAGWRVWLAAGSIGNARTELSVYLVGLILNALWTPLFFALGLPVAAMVDILALDLVIIVTAVLFWRRDRVAGWVFLPYLAWTLFATALNGAIIALN
ncbi:TspO/MBR family protein [Saccharopolyspora sp. MS10]|uniref:TspO/MBR family protein n=1 Tax=Saccharopolyspora sp. MS10 TaxID=3385973 RepID=UPI0039A058F9